MVRVAALENAIEEGDLAPDAAGLRPRQQSEAVHARAHEMTDALGRTLCDEILPGLGDHGVRLAALADLEEMQRIALSRHFQRGGLARADAARHRRVAPVPAPLQPEPQPRAAAGPWRGETEPRLAMVQVPSGLRRLVRPAGVEGSTYVLLEEVVRAELASLFPGRRCWKARRSAWRATPSWSSTTRAGGRTWRRWRRS